METQDKWLTFYMAFFNNFDEEKFSNQYKIYKAFAECYFNDLFHPEMINLIQDKDTKKTMLDFLKECEKCAKIAVEDMEKYANEDLKIKRNRAQRRRIEKSTSDRIKDAGLISLTPQVPKEKKLIV